MANSESLKVISEFHVRPDHQVEPSKQRHYLGPIDLCMLAINPISKGLLFSFQTNPTRIEIPSLVERLKRSLSLALVHFYPLAGQFQTIKYPDQHSCSIYLDCAKGPGARLVHATRLDLAVSDILSSVDRHPAVESFFDLGENTINYDGHTRPLLSVQVTELQDGVFIGFSMNHSVADGTSFIHFVSSLSQIFKLESESELEEKPVRISRVPLYKPFIPEGYGPLLKLPYLEPEEFITWNDPDLLRERIFHFSPESMGRLKAKANEDGGGGGETHIVSSFMALSSLVWRSITRARNLAGDETTSWFLPVNARSRLDPPLSDDYFGNKLHQVSGACKVDELLGQSLGWGARFLSQEVKKNSTPEKIAESLKIFADTQLVGKPGTNQPEFYKSVHNVIIGGSPRFDMYGPEFGLGRAVGVRMGFGNKECGKVTANPGCEGRGSVDLEIYLRPQIMSALEADEEFLHFICVD